MSQQIAVIQYNAGNIHSVLSALHRLGFKGILTDNPEIIQSSDKVIFPGVGEARSTMNHLRKKGLDEIIKNLTQPVLSVGFRFGPFPFRSVYMAPGPELLKYRADI